MTHQLKILGSGHLVSMWTGHLWVACASSCHSLLVESGLLATGAAAAEQAGRSRADARGPGDSQHELLFTFASPHPPPVRLNLPTAVLALGVAPSLPRTFRLFAGRLAECKNLIQPQTKLATSRHRRGGKSARNETAPDALGSVKPDGICRWDPDARPGMCDAQGTLCEEWPRPKLQEADMGHSVKWYCGLLRLGLLDINAQAQTNAPPQSDGVFRGNLPSKNSQDLGKKPTNLAPCTFSYWAVSRRYTMRPWADTPRRPG